MKSKYNNPEEEKLNSYINNLKYLYIVFIIIGLSIFLYLFNFDNSKELNNANNKSSSMITINDSIEYARHDSINKVNDSLARVKKEKEESDFLKTKAGKIYIKHPEWSKDDCIKLANGKIWIGMHYDMLVYLRGKPNSINTSNYGQGNEYQACWYDYDPGCFYFNETSIITAYN